MTFFKIIKNKKVISVGCVFLKWREDNHQFFICDVDEGQFVLSYDEKYIYRDTWMKPAPKDATKYEEATVEIITQQEYEDLLAMLDEGETVEEVVPVIPEQQEEIVPPQEEEKPMTIAEMREIILKQQEQINSLLGLFE